MTDLQAPREIRKITPPNLHADHLGDKITCYRPMRHGSPNMSVEQIGDKVVAHNYGHGGSGWTLAPGAAAYVNKLLLQSSDAHNLERDTPIAIVGAGILGLFTAYDFLQRGYSAITISAEGFDALASNNAGGLLAIFVMDNASETQALINKIALESCAFYVSVINGQKPELADGAMRVPVYIESKENSELELYVKAGMMQAAKHVVLDFDNGTTRKMVVYDDGIFIDVTKITADLTNYLKAKKVVFNKRKLNSFSEIKDKYIINCSGLGAEQLHGDNQMESVQGHMVALKNQSADMLHYLVSVDLSKGETENGQLVDRLFYMMPKRFPNGAQNDVGVIGGTFIPGATPATPNEKEFDLLINRAREFYGCPQ